jgi:glycosyltransferase involved in cell wall biosynthesis
MSRPLHQVLVSPRIGGAAVVAMRLAGMARRLGVPTRAWVPGRGPASEKLDHDGVPWHLYDLSAMRRSAVAHAWSCAKMTPALIRYGRPIVHVHNPLVYRILRPALVAAGARMVVHFHLEPEPGEVESTLAHPPDHIVVCARYIGDRVRQGLTPRSENLPITAVPNAIDLDRYTPGTAADARKRIGLPADGFVVLVMANLAPHKGHATAIRAIHALRGRGIPVELWVAGEDRSGGGEFESGLRALCAQLGVAESVRFLGFRSDGPDLLRAADAFVLASTHEGLPLSILEAHAAQVPVVATPIPGILEVVEDGRTGFVVPPEDHLGYADRLALLFGNAERRRSIVAAAAAQVAQQHGWDALERTILPVYRSLGLQVNQAHGRPA